MKMLWSRSALVLSGSIAVGGWLVGAQPAVAEAPPYLPLQGFLTDPDGKPIDGEVGIRFRLYSAATGGDVLWEETQPDVNVDDGQLTVYLGDVEPLDLAIFAEQALVWVGVKVGDDPESTPRVQLGTAAFAAYADQCGDAETLGGTPAASFAASDHSHPPVNAATLCEAGEYLDGNGSCKVATSGDITGITTAAGSGLSGGCSSGTCNMSVNTADFMGGSDSYRTELDRTSMVVPKGATEPLLSLTITTGAGTVLVNGYARVVSASSGSAEGSLRLSHQSLGYATASYVGWSSTGSSDAQYPSSTYLYEKPAGTRTYYLIGGCNSGSGNDCEYNNRSLQLRFIPY